ncbi:MAG TPA: type II toxin-antitoxin system RelE/ParE family toxin [Opitutales bacterium]|nr:type II toxin-antitoxin system RelE/ParE family toxin [Opitutales bacterium]
MKVVLHRLAREELVAAAQYLEAEAGFGADFLDAFETWAQTIRQFPESGPIIGHNIRKGLLLRFHYIIAYEIKYDAIRVLYIRHAKQKTPNWARRRG